MNKKVAHLGIFLSLALICSYIESLIPFYFGVPGMKLGLTNIVVVYVMYTMTPVDALIISILRVLVSGFLFGNGFSMIYSLCGAVLSFVVMLILYLMKKFKLITVSVFGGMFHNVGQIIVASVIVSNYNVLYYLPILLVAGFITGLLIGIISQEIIFRVKRS